MKKPEGKLTVCSRGHEYYKSKERPVCPECWPGFYTRGKNGKPKVPTKRYLALLRGVNVGGNALVPMVRLKEVFEKAGFGEVVTYIQSGNVVFSSFKHNPGELESGIERALAREFKLPIKVVVLPASALRDAVKRAPKGFGSKPGTYRYDVIFLKKPLTPRQAMKHVLTKDGVDEARAGKGVLYFSRLAAKASSSRLSRITQVPVYKELTIRNWNTTTKLLSLLEKKN